MKSPERPPVLSRQTSSFRQLLAALLSLCLGLFLTDAVVSLLDDSLKLFFGVPLLGGLSLIIGLFALFFLCVVYVLMALTPAIPKRLFVPPAFYYLVTQLLILPAFFLAPYYLQLISWIFSLIQVLVAVCVIYMARGGPNFSWMLMPVRRLGARNFSWLNLIGFSGVNAFVLLPAILIYLFVCTAWALNHFSEGFEALHTNGISVQMRRYVRSDGKTIQLFPMIHVADADFYHKVVQTFPTNSVILLEGVTDEKHLLKNKLSYQRMARKLGLAEQHLSFEPSRGHPVAADIDVDQFSTNTLDLLNLVILIHIHGLDVKTLQKLAQYPMTPDAFTQMQYDVLDKRNEHLLSEIHDHLPDADYIVVPWGAAHMPGISREIQKDGFRLVEAQDYMVIRFHH
jgi:hypothetical protein